MDHDNVPAPAQIFKTATEHEGLTTAFGAEIGRVEAGRARDVVVIDYNKASYPYQDEDIPPLDTLIQRAKTKDVKEVFIDGRTVLIDGIFTMVDKENVLSKIHEALNSPRDEDEVDRRYFREKVFPFVENFMKIT